MERKAVRRRSARPLLKKRAKKSEGEARRPRLFAFRRGERPAPRGARAAAVRKRLRRGRRSAGTGRAEPRESRRGALGQGAETPGESLETGLRRAEGRQTGSAVFAFGPKTSAKLGEVPRRSDGPSPGFFSSSRPPDRRACPRGLSASRIPPTSGPRPPIRPPACALAPTPPDALISRSFGLLGRFPGRLAILSGRGRSAPRRAFSEPEPPTEPRKPPRSARSASTRKPRPIRLYIRFRLRSPVLLRA